MALQLRATRVLGSTLKAGVMLVASFAIALQPLSVLPIASAAATPSDVWITAAMPQPAPGKTEYVKLQNKSASAVNLNGWKINDGTDRLITAAASLASNASVIICEDNAMDAVCDMNYSVPGLSLNDSGATITLKDGAVDVDQVTYASSVEGMENTFATHTAAPAPVCTYDFPNDDMWEVTYGYDFADRNGGTPVFDINSNGGMTSVNGGAVPSYMTGSWHWLYLTPTQTRTNYEYGFADGTTRTADVTFGVVGGCRVPTSIVWNTQTPTGTRYVSTTSGNDTANLCVFESSPCKTIQHAINKANNGETINVKAGTYNESVNVNKPVKLIGAQATVDPRPSQGTARVVGGSDETIVVAQKGQQVFKIAADDVTIDGFEIEQNGGAGAADAVKASNSQLNLTIMNNIVTNVTDEAIQLEAGDNYNVSQNYILNPVGDGITFSTYDPLKGSSLRIINNDIKGSTSGFGSIYLYGVSNVTISGNVIDTKSSGMAIGSDGLRASNVTITGNTIRTELHAAYSAYALGIGIDGNSANVKLTGNTITQVGTPTAAESAYPERHALIRVGVAAAANPSGVVLHNNNLSKINPINYVYVSPTVTNVVSAERNWWSADTTPTEKITSTNATVNYDPWLCETYTGQANPAQSISGVCDTTAPEVTVDPITGTKSNNSNIVITGTVKDNETNVTGFTVTVDGTSYTPNFTGDDWKITVPAGTLSDGTHTVKATATNQAGLTNSATAQLTTDSSAPVFSSKSAVRNADGSYTLSATSPDTDIDGSTVQLLLNSTQQSPVTMTSDGNGNSTWSAVTAPLMKGLTYTFAVSATDNTGNSMTSSPQSFVVPANVVVTQGQNGGFTTTSGVISPLSPVKNPALFSTSEIAANAAGDSDTDGQVLGTNTDGEKDKDSQADKVATIAPSEEGWKLFGIAWYWYLLALAAVVAGWFGARQYRRNREDF